MIKITRTSGGEVGRQTYGIALDDVELSNEQASVSRARRGYWVNIFAPDFYEAVVDHSLLELTSYIHTLTVAVPDDFPGPTDEIVFYRSDAGWEIAFRIEFDVSDWKEPWSISEYVHEFGRVVETCGLPAVSWEMENDEEPSEGFSVDFLVEDLTGNLAAEIARWLPTLHQFETQATDNLSIRTRQDSVVTLFDFPDAVRVPCEQYLLYFIQFLKDLGVDATAELQHSAGGVLFAVSPVDPGEALWRIREALDLYLKIPMTPDFNAYANTSPDISIQQLIANVQHLRGQLALASAMLQYKDATISQQQLTIDEQRRLVTGEVISDSIRDANLPEELLGGTVALTKHNILGVELNLAEIFRHLKRLFSRKSPEGEP